MGLLVGFGVGGLVGVLHEGLLEQGVHDLVGVGSDHKAGNSQGADAVGHDGPGKAVAEAVPAVMAVAKLVDVVGVLRGDQHFGGHLSAS